MTENEFLAEILAMLARSEAGSVIFTPSDIDQWPLAFLEGLVADGLLGQIGHLRSVECSGCERNCFKPVFVRMNEDTTWAFVNCDEPEDLGRIRIDVSRLHRWQITGGRLAQVVSALLGISTLPCDTEYGKRWLLGSLSESTEGGALSLSIESAATLQGGGNIIPLTKILVLVDSRLRVDMDLVRRFASGDDLRSPADVGSPAWRKKRARDAASARYDQQGGSREKLHRLRGIWASGKHPSRNVCAQRECAALGISVSTARKALKGTPDPKR